MAHRTTRRAPSRRGVELHGAPATRLAPHSTTWARDTTLCVAAGLAGAGTAPVLGHPALTLPTLGAGTLLGLARAVVGARARARRQLVDRLLEALGPGLGLRVLDRRAVRASRWTRGWPGAPGRLDLRYAPGVDDSDPAWRAELVATTGRRLLGDYEVLAHDRARCRLRLGRVPPAAPAPATPAVQVRAERTVTELLGPTAVVTSVRWSAQDQLAAVAVRHEAGAKLAAAGYRHRVERVVSTMLPGRWRATWDMEGDQVTFEVRPSFPVNLWLPVLHVPRDRDVLATYDDLEIPYGVDEDGQQVVWRPARDPNLMLVGAPGTGKSLGLDTKVATPSGWTTMGDLADGDLVFDDQGQPCTVVKAHPVRYGRPCYRVTFSDGSTVVADGEHLWQTSTTAERASRRRGEARRRQDRRPLRMSAEQLARLRAALDGCSPDDVISVPDIARLAGIRPSAPILRQLRRQVPLAGRQPRPRADFTYAEQVVESVQTVNAYPRRQVLEQVTASVAAGRGRLPCDSVDRLAELGGAEGEDELISTSQLQQLLGVDHPTVSRLLRLSDIPAVKRQETVRGVIPAHVERRRLPGPPVEVHPKRQLLEALVQWGSGRAREGKPLGPPSSVRTTEDIAATLTGRDGKVNHAVAVARPIQCPLADLPLSPYALGVWLGDGGVWGSTFTSADPDIAALVQAAGTEVVDHGRPAAKPESYRARTYAMRGVSKPLEALGLLRRPDPVRRARRKHIPPLYLRAAVEQRRALLAGLMDTDGTVAPQGACQFTNTTEQLARDVHELAASLGFRATLTTGRATLDGRDCGPKWTVAWTTQEPVFQLHRKQLAHQERTAQANAERIAYRYITAVEPVDSVPVRCLTVDSPSRLYLVGETFIPTHNTVTAHTLLVNATRYEWPVWVVDGKSIEFLGFQDWPNVQVVATSIEEQIAVIHRAWELMEHRYDLITSGRAEECDFEPLLVFLDEFADFRGNLAAWYADVKVKGDPAKPAVLGRVQSIARKGRTARVHLVFATQRPDAEYFGGDMRDNFRMRVSMGRLSPEGAMMMWESPTVGTSIPRGCRGRATTINDDNRAVESQTYRTPDPRKTPTGSEEEQLLDRLRPPAARHQRLLVLPPQADADLNDVDGVDGAGAPQATYTDYATAPWVLASTRPDLDPVRQRARTDDGHRTSASPMTLFGLQEPPRRNTATPPAARSPRELLTLPGTLPTPRGPEAPPAPLRAPRLLRPPDQLSGGEQVVPAQDAVGDVAGDVPEDVDEYADYGAARPRLPAQLDIGDLIALEDDEDQWVLIDADPEEDPTDPDCVALSWRGDGDERGSMSVPADQPLPARAPLDADAPFDTPLEGPFDTQEDM